MVKAEENDPHLLLRALKAGHFYASQGPAIDGMRRGDDTLAIRCSPATQICAVGPVALSEHVEGTSLTRATLSLDPFKGNWCRVIIRGTMSHQAWTNPMWLTDA